MWRALAIACAMLPLGCRQLLSSDSYQFVATGEDSGAGGGAAQTAEGGTNSDASEDGSVCKLARPLERTLTAEVGGTTELVFVTRVMDVGETTGDDGVPRFLKLGYDLDNHCGDRRCRNPLDQNPQDRAGVDGIDDALGRMIANIKKTFDTEIVSSAQVNQQTNDGQIPPVALFRIRNYDGLQDDNHVDVDWYAPVLLGATAEAGIPDGGTAPKWDGNDVWPIEPTTFEQPPSADGKMPGHGMVPRTSIEAYVSSYHLVAKFPDGIPFRFWLFGAPLYSPVVTASIFPNTITKKFELRDGLITGRASMRDVLSLIPVMTLALPTNAALCTDSPLYPNISDFICTYPDLSSSSNEGSDCDMMSASLGFDTAPAKIGEVIQVTPPAPLCPPEIDPAKLPCFTLPDGGADQ
jgi:hypothetical protein